MKKVLCACLAAIFAVSMAGAAEFVRPAWAKGVNEVTGKITVYTTMEETQQAVQRDLWEKLYPNCALEFQSDSIGTLMTRIKSESANPVADVVAGGLFEADGARFHELLQPYVSVNDPDQNYHDKTGYYTFFDVQVMSLVVNKDLEAELGLDIQGYQDILNPKLRGQIILANPAASSSAYRQLQTMLATMGDRFDDDKGWAYIRQLMELCDGVITNSSTQVFNDVINGEYVVGLSYESTVQAMIDSGADNIRNVYMEEGNTTMAGGGAVVKGAPNLVAAQAMMDLLASSLFQDARSEQSGGRGTNRLCKDSGLPKDDTLGLVPLDFNYLVQHQAELLDKWARMWAEVN